MVENDIAMIFDGIVEDADIQSLLFAQLGIGKDIKIVERVELPL